MLDPPSTESLPLRGKNHIAAGDQALHGLLYFLLPIGAWNTILRPGPESSVTAFYVMAPPLIAFLFLLEPVIRIWLWVFVGVAAYGWTIGSIYGVPADKMAAQIAHYGYIFMLFAAMQFLERRDPRFYDRSMALLWTLTIVAFLLAGLQELTGFELPNVSQVEAGLWLNAFFFSPNDFALFIATFYCLVITGRSSIMTKIIFTALSTLLIIRNDARAAILAMFIMISIYFIIKFSLRIKIPPIVFIVFSSIMSPLLIFTFLVVNLNLVDSQIDLAEIISDPIKRILTLHPYYAAGSIFDRTDALIFNIIEFSKMYGLGLGPGGSVAVLAQPQYHLVTAESLHNAIAELMVDMGPMFAIPLLHFIVKSLRPAFHLDMSSGQIASLCFVASMPLLAVTQSSGFISNYAFWIVFYLIARAPNWLDQPAVLTPAPTAGVP